MAPVSGRASDTGTSVVVAHDRRSLAPASGCAVVRAHLARLCQGNGRVWRRRQGDQRHRDGRGVELQTQTSRGSAKARSNGGLSTDAGWLLVDASNTCDSIPLSRTSCGRDRGADAGRHVAPIRRGLGSVAKQSSTPHALGAVPSVRQCFLVTTPQITTICKRHLIQVREKRRGFPYVAFVVVRRPLFTSRVDISAIDCWVESRWCGTKEDVEGRGEEGGPGFTDRDTDVHTHVNPYIHTSIQISK